MSSSRSDGDPVGICAHLGGGVFVLTPSRGADPQLTVTVISPGPERPVRFQRHRVARSSIDHSPIAYRSISPVSRNHKNKDRKEKYEKRYLGEIDLIFFHSKYHINPPFLPAADMKIGQPGKVINFLLLLICFITSSLLVQVLHTSLEVSFDPFNKYSSTIFRFP
jgi:hypothetical protein